MLRLLRMMIYLLNMGGFFATMGTSPQLQALGGRPFGGRIRSEAPRWCWGTPLPKL